MSDEQPPPVPNGDADIWLDVIGQMQERRNVGIERYGTPLQPFNGRCAERDAFEEALDLVVYLRQAMIERAALNAEVDGLRQAIADAGFGILKSSDKWSIHDISERGKAEEAKSLEVATQNVYLEIEVERLREECKGWNTETHVGVASGERRPSCKAVDCRRADRRAV